MERFQYRPLDPARSEIRLLSLAPAANEEAEIECTLTTVDLGVQPVYEALSYTWGDATDRRAIRLDGHRFSVTKNLEIALRHLREPATNRILWIDAICINQDDLEERSRQVQKMGNIFGSAWRVVGWLGEAADDSDLAMDIIARDDFESVTDLNTLTALVRFGSRPYFRRAWVIQELAANTECILCCGYKRIDIRDFWDSGFYSYLKRIHLIAGSFNQTSENDKPYAPQMLDALASCSGADGETHSLSHIWLATRGFLCTDPRDTVFSLLGVPAVKYSDRAGLVSDYTKPLEQILQQLVLHLLATDRELSILSGLRKENAPLGPSWLPDLSAQDMNLDTGVWHPHHTDCRASFFTKPCVSISGDSRLLTVRGLMLDFVDESIGPVNASNVPELKKILKAMEKTALGIPARLQNHGRSPKYENYKKAFRCTLTGKMKDSPSRFPEGSDPRWYELLMSPAGSPTNRVPESRKMSRKPENFWALLKDLILYDRCFFTTRNGYMGIGPHDVQSWDSVTILYGGKFCYVLRKAGKHYRLKGDAYVHGAMNGEFMGMHLEQEGGAFEEQDFVLC